MHRLVQVKKEKTDIVLVNTPKLSEQFKKDLIKARKDIKAGKFTRYNNAREILDELGL